MITLKEKVDRDMHGDVLVVDPPWDITNDKRNGIRASSRWPHEYPPSSPQCNFPFFMGYAVSFLRSHGINAHLTTFAPPRISYKQFLDEIVKRGYKFILVETSTPTIKSDLAFCRDLKDRMDCLIALVGGYASAHAEECIAHDQVDAVLKGEYELNAFEFVTTGKPGIYNYNIIKDINELPFPYRRDVIFGDILYRDGSLGAKAKRQIQMWGSRSCPYRCSFCMYPPVMYNNTAYRTRSAENIGKELDYLIQKQGGNDFHIYFDDDTFNIGEKRMMAIADEFGKRGIEYVAMCRADTIKNFDTLKYMRERGFVGCKIGVESGCQELVDACNKQLDLNDVRRFRKWCDELGIFIHMTFTFGLEGETKETMQRTKAFINEVSPDSIQTSACSPVEGTPYYDYLKSKGLITEDAKLDGTVILNLEDA